MYRRSVAVTGRYDRLRIENQEQGLRSKISWFYLSTILTKLCSYELDWVEFTEINWQFSLLCAMFILCLDRNFNAIYLMLSLFLSRCLPHHLCKFHLSYIVLHVWYCKKSYWERCLRFKLFNLALQCSILLLYGFNDLNHTFSYMYKHLSAAFATISTRLW